MNQTDPGNTVVAGRGSPATGRRPLATPSSRDSLRLIRSMFNDPAGALDPIRASVGTDCLLAAGPVKIAVIGDPSIVSELLTMPASQFRWAHRYNVIGLRFVIGRTSMIVSDGADHDRRRGAVQPAFAKRRLNSWAPMILHDTDLAIERLVAYAGGTEGTVDVYPHMRRLVLGITLRAFFGERMAAHVDEISDRYLRPQHFIEAPAIRQLPHPIPFTNRARVRADKRAINGLIDDEITQRRRSPPPDRPDVLDLMLARDSLTDTEIRDQARTLIGAGYDTTAAAIAWMLLRATATPGVWTQLRHEADTVLHPRATSTEGSADDDTLARLVYAGRVVRESLRLHPAGLIGARAAAHDLVLGGGTVPRGTLILWSPYLAGRDPETWSAPLDFDPDRFVELSPQQKSINDRAWIPFGRGPHACLGFALAQMEMTLIVSRLAQRLDVITTLATMPRPIGLIVNRPEGGAPLSVTARPTAHVANP